MVEDIISDLEDRMKKSVTALQKDFAAIRTGRANPAMFDGNVYAARPFHECGATSGL